jgi:hypothetical protein
MIHEDVDLTSERPTLKLDAGTSFRYTNGGVSSVNVMAASLDSRSNKSIQEPKKDADDQDDDETEVVTPFDEDKVWFHPSFPSYPSCLPSFPAISE